MAVRLVIVDDDDGFRAIARVMLESEGLEVVGEADDGDSAVAVTVAVWPDIVLLDVHLSGMDGFAVSRRLAALASPPAVVLISSRPITDLRRRVAASPVVGFLAKDDFSGAAVTALTG